MGAGHQGAGGARADEAGSAPVQRGAAERPSALVDEDEDVVELVGEAEGRVRRESDRFEGELGALLGRDERVALDAAFGVGRDALGVGHAGGHAETLRGPGVRLPGGRGDGGSLRR